MAIEVKYREPEDRPIRDITVACSLSPSDTLEVTNSCGEFFITINEYGKAAQIRLTADTLAQLGVLLQKFANNPPSR